MNEIRFKYTILYVENVPETLDFYNKAFGLKQAMLHESGDYGELDTGTTTLSFSSLQLMTSIGKNPEQPNPEKPTFEIAFETDNVPSSLAKAVNAGAKIIQEPEDMPWGQTTAYVHDINGFLVEICSPVSGQS